MRRNWRDAIHIILHAAVVDLKGVIYEGNWYVRACNIIFTLSVYGLCRSQWPRSRRRRSTAPRPLRLWVRIPPEAWMFVCCECCVLSGRGLCDGLITCPEESYRLWRVVVCDLETSKMRRLKPATGLWKYNQRVVTPRKQTYMVCRS